MKTMKKYCRTIILAALGLALAACSRDPFDGPGKSNHGRPGEMSFGVELMSGPTTRTDFTTHDIVTPDGEEAKIEAYLRPMGGVKMGETPETKAAPIESMYNSFSFVANGIPETVARLSGDGKYYADGGVKFSDMPTESAFFCWGPLEAPGVDYNETTGKISYVTPEDVANQKDLVVSLSTVVSPNNTDPVELTFKHALAGVQVKAASMFPDGSVKSVVLKNVYGSGIYDPESGTWTVDPASITDVTLLDNAVNGITASSPIVNGEYTGMLVPQVLPENAQLYIKLNHRRTDFEYVVPINGVSLAKGTIFTFDVDGRNMWLFEGTANGPFVVQGWSGLYGANPYTNLITVEPDENGHFSVYLPPLPLDQTETGRTYIFVGSNKLETVTHMPDVISSLTCWGQMFKNCSALTSLPDYFPPGLKVNRIEDMFKGCTSLVDASNIIFGAEKITNFSGAFDGCQNIVAVPWFDTSEGTNFSEMFRYCYKLTGIPDYDTSKGTSFYRMFYECRSLTTAPNINTGKGTNFSEMFRNCYALTTVPQYDTGKGTNFNSMFFNCSSLTAVPQFNTENGTSFLSMFQGCSRLVTIPLLNTGKGTRFDSMFYQCTSLTGIPAIDTSKGDRFDAMFYECRSLLETPALNLSSARILFNMFYGCTKITTSYAFNTSNVTSVQGMFNGCTSLVSVPMMDFTKVTTMQQTFQGCSSLTDVPDFNTTVCGSFNMTFYQCKNLVVAPNMDYSHATNMSNTFNGCTKITTFPEPFVLTAATNLSSCFANCKALVNMPHIVIPNAVNMEKTFEQCSALANWYAFDSPKVQIWKATFYYALSPETIPQYDYSSATSMNQLFFQASGTGRIVTLPAVNSPESATMTNWLNGQSRITYFGGFIGRTTSVNMTAATWNNLTHESWTDIIANLGTAASGASLTMTAANYAKLDANDIAAATAKGWTIVSQ